MVPPQPLPPRHTPTPEVHVPPATTKAERSWLSTVGRIVTDEPKELRAISMAQDPTGHVSSGQGDLAHWMTLHADAYEAATGQRLVPGSLNVVLPHEWCLPVDVPLRLEPERVGVGMSLVPCRVEGVEAFIARTDRNDAGTGTHSRRVIEVVSSVHLRSELRLDDGDEVSIAIP